MIKKDIMVSAAVPIEDIKPGMVTSDYVDTTNEDGIYFMLTGPDIKLTDHLIDRKFPTWRKAVTPKKVEYKG